MEGMVVVVGGGATTATVVVVGARVVVVGGSVVVVDGTTVVVVAAVRVFFERSVLGKAMRAAAANGFAATLVGIDVKRMVAASFALSAAVGAVAGIIITPVALTAFDRGTLLGIEVSEGIRFGRARLQDRAHPRLASRWQRILDEYTASGDCSRKVAAATDALTVDR